jgi:lipid-A-disaccharide synthase
LIQPAPVSAGCFARKVSITKRRRLVLSAGEASGDQIGADLAQALKERQPDIELAGLAGPRMQAAGVEPWYGLDSLNVMGLTEVITHLPRLVRLRRQFLNRMINWPADAFIGIDAPDFNLGLAKKARQQGVFAIHYVSPSVWAWRAHRVKKIAGSLDLLLTLFPFEADIYRPHGLDTRFVGHHLARQLRDEPDRFSARAALGLSSQETVIALLPGSRAGELDRHARLLGQTALELRRQKPEATLLVLLAEAGHEDRLRAGSASLLDQAGVEILVGRTRTGLRAADLALAASGTVTLEAFLLGCPLVVFYRLAPTTYWIARGLRLVKSRHVSLPNILAGRELVPERLQHQATPDCLVKDALAWLDQPQRVADYLTAATECSQQLATESGHLAARAILERLGHE